MTVFVTGDPATALSFQVAYGGRAPSINERLHWAKLRNRLRPWREATALAASYYDGPKPLPPSFVRMVFPSATKIRKDPHNYTGTLVKACIDELVKAGIFVDDTPDNVFVVDPRIVHIPGLDKPETGLANRAFARIDVIPRTAIDNAALPPEVKAMFSTEPEDDT